MICESLHFMRSQRLNIPLVLSTAVAALGGLLLGFDTAVIAGATQALSHSFGLTPLMLGLTVSCAIWGTVLGGLLAAIPGERYGGRESLRITAVLYLVSALGCALSERWGMFLLFRFLSGLAIGGCSVFSPMYIAETAPAALRGRLVACFQLSIVTGILVAYGSNATLTLALAGPALWRFELGVAALPAALFLLLLSSIPQSPRWLVKQGRLDEACTVLRTIGSDDPSRDAAAIEAALASASGQRAPSLFSAEFRRPLLIALALGLFNQLSGINAILYYLNDIFAQAGFRSVSASGQAIAIGVANLVFTLVGVALIDRVGRKPLLLGGAAGMAISLTGVAAIFLAGRMQSLLLPLLISFIGFFAASQGAVVWVYLSEIFPSAIREKGQSLASSWLWLLTAIVSGVFPSLAAISRGYPFILFAAAMAAQFLVVLWFFPETKGNSLEQIQQALSGEARV